MDLSIIIVSWNTQDLLRKCLNSIYQNLDGLNLEIFVGDNNSSDKTAQMVKAEFPQVNLITNNKNLGFAKANNQAIKQVNISNLSGNQDEGVKFVIILEVNPGLFLNNQVKQ